MKQRIWMVSAFAATAWLTITVPVSAQTCQAVPIDCLQPTALAHIDGARFTWGSTGGDNSDAWVARFDGDATEPTWQIPLAGSGIDSVDTVTLNRGGEELLVAGATTSATLEGLSGRNAGGRDGFVARLDTKTGRLLSGRLVGGKGDEELSGVVSDGEGNIVVSGIGTPSSFGEPPALLTVVESAAVADDRGSPVFLAIFDRSLTRETAISSLGDLHVKRPRLWTNCDGELVVGVAILGPSNCAGAPIGGWPDKVYERSQMNRNFLPDQTWGNSLTTPSNGVTGGWGYHALRWKYFREQQVNNPLVQLTFSGYIPQFGDNHLWSPYQRPGCYDVPYLNTLETNVFSSAGSGVYDPAGGWSCGLQYNMAELALYTAHLMTLWHTPVYAHFNAFDPVSSINWPYAAGIDRVTFVPLCTSPNPVYNGEGVENLCLFTQPTPPDPQYPQGRYQCQLSTGIPGILGSGFNLAVKTFEGSSWGPYVGAPTPTQSFFTPGRLWESDFPSWYDSGEFVYDPPEGSEEELAILQDRVRQSAGLVMRPGTVQVRKLDKGASSCTQTVEAYLSATE